MWDLFSSWQEYLNSFVITASLLAGLAGSLHCVGMCGGLVTASTKNLQQVGLYQIGRLIGYMIIGIVMGTVGSLFQLNTTHPALNYLPSFLIGGLFIFWGVQSLWGQRLHVPAPQFFTRLYQRSWRRVINGKAGNWKGFFTGLISLFLPCGLLYGVILGSLALQNPWLSGLSMLAFWLGTLPSMMLAPQLVRKILNPLRTHRPKFYAVALMLMGVLTIGWRASKIQHFTKPSAPSEAKSCH